MEGRVDAEHHAVAPHGLAGVLYLASHGHAGSFEPEVVVLAGHLYAAVDIDAVAVAHVYHHHGHVGVAFGQQAYLPREREGRVAAVDEHRLSVGAGYVHDGIDSRGVGGEGVEERLHLHAGEAFVAQIMLKHIACLLAEVGVHPAERGDALRHFAPCLVQLLVEVCASRAEYGLLDIVLVHLGGEEPRVEIHIEGASEEADVGMGVYLAEAGKVFTNGVFHGVLLQTRLRLSVSAEHLHGAEFAAHGADFFFFVRFAALFHLRRVERGTGHAVPVEGLAGGIHGGFAGKGAGRAESYFAGMGGYAGGHDACAGIGFVGQGEMFGRSEIAEEVHTGFYAQSTADGAGDVVVAGRTVAAERAEHIERRAVGQTLDALYLRAHLMQGHMAGAFYHALHASVVRAGGEQSEVDDFFPLGGVAGIHAGAGAQAVAEGERHVVGQADVEQAVEVFKQRVLAAVVQHPAGQHGAAARDDAHGAFGAGAKLRAAPRKPAMHGDVVHALPGLLFDFLKELVGRHGGDLAASVQYLLAHGIHGNSAQRKGAVGEQGLADGVEVACDGKIHHRVRAGLDDGLELAAFGLHAGGEGRGADVGVHLDARGLAHEYGLQAGMSRVAEEYHGAFFDGGKYGFRLKPFLCGEGGEMLVEQAAQSGVLGNEG